MRTPPAGFHHAIAETESRPIIIHGRQSTDKTRDYTPLLCSWQMSVTEGLTPDMAGIILAGDRPPFWHWEGNALVVDGYYLQAETSFINLRDGERRGGIHSAERRMGKRRKALHKALKNRVGCRVKGACPIKIG